MAPSRPRIALIGPVLPFRGGIAQHTTMMRRALVGVADVKAFSFSRQYPKILFPGESDRDPAFAGHSEPGTSYRIDSVNPLTWSAAVREIREWAPDLVVIPWWTIYFVPCFGYIAGRLRAAGIPVVFVCHNVIEHESAPWRVALARRVLRAGSGFVVHTGIDEQNLLALLPGARIARHAHPVYEQFPPADESMVAEHELELLFFGFVRPYKGLDLLIEAVALVPASVDLRLTVAGEFWNGPDATMARIEELGVADRIEVHAGYMTEDQVAGYFGRAHAAMLPYRSATGSGVVAVAYNYDVPVVVTRVGGLPDVVEDGMTGYVVEPDSPEALAAAIEQLATADIQAMRAAVATYKREHLSWEGLGRAVFAAGGLTPVADREAVSAGA